MQDYLLTRTFYCATIEKIQLQFMLIPNYRYKLHRKNATNKSSAKHYIITQSKCFLDCRQKLRKQNTMSLSAHRYTIVRVRLQTVANN